MSGLLSSLSTGIVGLLTSLRPASFRGVPFGVRGGGKDFGRRVVTHRFPLRDTTQHEDMGRKERIITFDAFLVGDDVRSRMTRLEAALEQKGPGRLVHPHYGELQVVVTSARMMTGLENGLAGYQVSFEIDDAASQQPSAGTNGGSLLDRLGLAGIAAAVEDYSRLLSFDGLQDFVAEHFGDQLAGLGIGLSDLASAYGLYQQLSGALNLLNSWTITAAGGSGSSGGAASPVVAASATAVTTAIAALAPSGQRPDAVLRVAAGDALAPPPAPLVQTPSRIAEATNAAALDTLVRATAAIEAARAGSAVAWDSREDALAYRDRVADALDDASDRAATLGWDATWRAAADIRAAWMTHVTSTAAPLPRVTVITLPMPTSAVLLAYRLDGDDLATLFTRAEDVVQRNGIAHPGFLPAGVPLEVLRDD